MSKQGTEVYNRITELMSFLKNDDTPVSVNEIADSFDEDPGRIRMDLQRLNNYGLSIEPKEIVTAFNVWDSRYDDEPLRLTFDLPVEEQYAPYLLFFETENEAELFTRYSIPDLKIKDSSLSESSQVTEHIRRIRDSIKKHRSIKFHYKDRQGNFFENVSLPEPILHHNATDDLWYCLQIGPDGKVIPFRLDRICSTIQMIEKKAEGNSIDSKILKRLDYFWGADFNNEEEPTHVKVLINANLPNILRKIKADTNSRKFASLKKRLPDENSIPIPSIWPQKGSYYLYEDDLIGLSSFRSWLMAFGSSVKVLEPKSLAEELYLSSVRRLDNYNENRFHE